MAYKDIKTDNKHLLDFDVNVHGPKSMSKPEISQSSLKSDQMQEEPGLEVQMAINGFFKINIGEDIDSSSIELPVSHIRYSPLKNYTKNDPEDMSTVSSLLHKPSNYYIGDELLDFTASSDHNSL